MFSGFEDDSSVRSHGCCAHLCALRTRRGFILFRRRVIFTQDFRQECHCRLSWCYISDFVDITIRKDFIEPCRACLQKNSCRSVKFEKKLLSISKSQGGEYSRLRTRSPQIVFRNHVRNPRKALLRLRHVGDSRITLKNFVSGSSPVTLSKGT